LNNACNPLKTITEVFTMKDRYSFIAVFDVAEDGISIEFPDLPGCLPCADTMEEALKNAHEALGLHLWGLEQDGEEIPEPTQIQNITLEKNQVPAVIEVFMPAFRDKLNNRFVKKTLSLPAWLADMADKDGVNCSKVFQNALIDYLGVKQ
jgi:predicted RNase H-like HicB family nuclease